MSIFLGLCEGSGTIISLLSTYLRRGPVWCWGNSPAEAELRHVVTPGVRHACAALFHPQQSFRSTGTSIRSTAFSLSTHSCISTSSVQWLPNFFVNQPSHENFVLCKSSSATSHQQIQLIWLAVTVLHSQLRHQHQNHNILAVFIVIFSSISAPVLANLKFNVFQCCYFDRFVFLHSAIII
jgi:hypothetical protein